MTVEYVIDGSRIDRMEDFWREIGAAVNGPGGYFGSNLNALIDCLRGDFGTPDDRDFAFVWTHSERSRSALGYPETVRQLSERLRWCYGPSYFDVCAAIDEADLGRGPTAFDGIVTVFAESSVELRLQ